MTRQCFCKYKSIFTSYDAIYAKRSHISYYVGVYMYIYYASVQYYVSYSMCTLHVYNIQISALRDTAMALISAIAVSLSATTLVASPSSVF